MSAHIYIIEDDQNILELIRFNLHLANYQTESFSAGDTGLERCFQNPPDLILLDVMLPGISGFDICKRLRENPKTKNIPVLMLTARSEEIDVVRGLELGADDYMTKPFSPNILLARVKNLLRRGHQEEEGLLEKSGIELHAGRCEVKVEGHRVDLTPTEFEILRLLMKRPGWVFSRSQIVEAIRGENFSVTDRTIDFQMVGLRKKLGDKSQLVETVRGVGYRFHEG